MEADMRWNPSLDPVCPDVVAVEAIETLIVPRARDIRAAGIRLLRYGDVLLDGLQAMTEREPTEAAVDDRSALRSGRCRMAMRTGRERRLAALPTT
jgi:hypothetical protein